MEFMSKIIHFYQKYKGGGFLKSQEVIVLICDLVWLHNELA